MGHPIHRFKIIDIKYSYSKLNKYFFPLAETDKVVGDGTKSKESSPSSPTLTFNKNKGIKKIFGKMKRSGSGNLEDLPAGVGEFQRGGVRATAAARLGWSDPQLSPR